VKKVRRSRRSSARLDKVFSVFLQGPDGGMFGVARNISEGGMLIETLDPYPIGCRLHITFSMPGSEVELTAVAEVVRNCVFRTSERGERPFIGIGVRFIEFCTEQSPERVPLEACQMQ